MTERPPDPPPEDPWAPPSGLPRDQPTPYFSPVSDGELVAPSSGGSRGWGIAAGLLGPLVLSFLAGFLAQWSPEAATALPLVGLIAAVGLAIYPRTRRFGVGVLMGIGLLLLIGAGACIVLIAGLTTLGG